MLKQVTLEKAIDIVRLSIAPSFCWPLPPRSSRAKLFLYKTTQLFATFSIISLLLPLLYAMYVRSDDIEIISLCLSQVILTTQGIIQTIICSNKHDTLQRIIEEMYICVKEMQQQEKEIFNTYLAKCNVIYASYIIVAYVMTSIYALGPTLFPMVNVVNAEYPFDTNRTSISVMIRAHQILTGYQCCSHLCLCVFGGLLFWFTAARFECLAVELQNNTNVRTLIACIEKQLHLKRYAEDVITCFRFTVLFVVALCSFLMTLCAVIMVMNTPVTVKLMLLLLNVYFLMYLYMYAWPADNMKDMVEHSLSLSTSAYGLTWYEQTLGMQKNLLYVMMYQKPVTLSIKCVIKELSLHYYCTYLSNALSFCTALRAILEEMTE
ncbi:hypothetical protein WN51_09468 [Melipona quadrifasciata]|uniref:Odorant receptor n=1 Tax=Melipona quadrifasciata TaxID=166423 RepID=A0A0M9A8M0_9HYME|nr:hypothetical protein WN51_09468 [Melipona quadrifasciata]